MGDRPRRRSNLVSLPSAFPSLVSRLSEQLIHAGQDFRSAAAAAASFHLLQNRGGRPTAADKHFRHTCAPNNQIGGPVRERRTRVARAAAAAARGGVLVVGAALESQNPP